MQADLAECGRQKQLIRRVRDLEATVAQRVGVSMVYTTTQLQLDPTYSHFLQRIADGAAMQGTVGWARCLLAALCSVCTPLAWLQFVEQNLL